MTRRERRRYYRTFHKSRYRAVCALFNKWLDAEMRIY
jgi:hypothetical protein